MPPPILFPVAILPRHKDGALGPGVDIQPPFYCDYGYNIFAGSHLSMNFGCVVLDCCPVRIGDDVLIGPYVQILGAYHPLDPKLRLTGRELASPVSIGNNVWIGAGAMIGARVTIGDNSVIGAGSIVITVYRTSDGSGIRHPPRLPPRFRPSAIRSPRRC